MSHTVKIQTKFTQLEPLKKAFEQFGWKIKEKSTARTYAYDPQKNKVYDLVAVNPGKEGSMTFDLGLTVKEDGEIDVLGDLWGGSIAQTLGNNLEKLKGEYAYRVIEQKYAYEGASVFRTVNQDGTQTVDVEFAQ